MLVCKILNGLQRGGHFLGWDEVNNRSFGIAPGQVREKLIYCIEVVLFAAPKLALCDKNILLFVAHENVGFAGFVEGLASRAGKFKARL